MEILDIIQTMKTFDFEDAALRLVGGVPFAYGPKPTKEDIADFEESIGAELPDDYKKFLLQTNGGDVSGFIAWTLDRVGLWEAYGMECVSGIGTSEGWSELPRTVQNPDAGPAGFLPIAHDAGGNYLYLNLNKEQAQAYGSLYVIDHEVYGESPYDFKYVAPSFTAFLKLVEPVDEEADNTVYDEIENALQKDDADTIEKIIREKRFRMNQIYTNGRTLADQSLYVGKKKVFERLVEMKALVPQFSLWAHTCFSDDEIVEYLRSAIYNR